MNQVHRNLILKLVANAISKEEFVEAYGSDPYTDKAHVLTLLQSAKAVKDAESFGYALILGFLFDTFTEAYLLLLNEAILEKWHFKHEDIASILYRLKSPQSVESLYQAAMTEHDYLDYDEDYMLADKCIRALKAIGTEEAKQKLQKLSRGKNKIIRSYAREALG